MPGAQERILDRPHPRGRGWPGTSDPGLRKERLASGLRIVNRKPRVAHSFPGLCPGLARSLNPGRRRPSFGRKSDFGKRKGEGATPPPRSPKSTSGSFSLRSC